VTPVWYVNMILVDIRGGNLAAGSELPPVRVVHQNPRRAPNTRRRNASERQRAARAFETWHEFKPHRVTKIKVPFTRWPKHVVKLGEVVRIDYRSPKWEGRSRTYTHTTRKPRPILVSDPDFRSVNLVGGAMRPTADGLVN
jgi:hypothetical protein